MPAFKLKNQIKHYEWGSPLWLPELLGIKNPASKPYAELWMGVHPSGPSEIEATGEALTNFITRNKFPPLPFLFKVLAAAKPLSIQAHPTKAQAAAGFEREQHLGIALDSPQRCYKDPNSKPEIICALTTFKAMVGFRDKKEIHDLLNIFISKFSPPAIEICDLLEYGLEGFLRALFELSKSQKELISAMLLENKSGLCENYPAHREVWETAAYFAELYYGDAGVLAPFYLNLLGLEPGEALFLPAGVLHAYIHGFGVELMSNSDNVLRGGLTSKAINVQELLNIINFDTFKPEVLVPDTGGTYVVPTIRAEAKVDFLLGMLNNGTSIEGPAIVLVTEGELAVGDGSVLLKRGESAYFTPGLETLHGDYVAYMAAPLRSYPA
jgi:mannose-6-phosphate isomerase